MTYQLELNHSSLEALKNNLINNYTLLEALLHINEINALNHNTVIHRKLFIKEYRNQKSNVQSVNQKQNVKIKNQISKLEYQKAYMKLLS